MTQWGLSLDANLTKWLSKCQGSLQRAKGKGLTQGIRMQAKIKKLKDTRIGVRQKWKSWI